MNDKELNEILKKHKLWLNHKKGGERANLSFTNLWETDLCRADLRFADMHGACLRGAILSQANLQGTDLGGAILSGANLWGANLSKADLREAILIKTNLNAADLRGADLRDANLRGADLYGAFLGENIILSVGCIGSRLDETIYNVTSDTVQCGCFRGTLDKFKAKVAKTYPDKNSLHRCEYEAAIAYFKAVAKARRGQLRTRQQAKTKND